VDVVRRATRQRLWKMNLRRMARVSVSRRHVIQSLVLLVRETHVFPKMLIATLPRVHITKLVKTITANKVIRIVPPRLTALITHVKLVDGLPRPYLLRSSASRSWEDQIRTSATMCTVKTPLDA